MVGICSLDLKERIVRSYLQGEAVRKVAEAFKHSLGFICCFIDLHPAVDAAADEGRIRSLVSARSSIYLDGIQ